ncbi:dihydropteroate synthase [Tsukamurella soli]|uniref:dihydropteroate synthase n=1 Tax=Tsukamurella soli TaxID=644556 RepID=A0ABP8J3T8_9ACTN
MIGALAAAGVTVSVDTMRASVATAALAAGAAIVNDVSGGRADPDMARVVADSSVPWVLMHWRSSLDLRHDFAEYDDVVTSVRDELLQQVELAVAAGVPAERVILDPGLGFAKRADHNWALLRSLDAFTGTGLRVLVGASRKRFLGELLGGRPPAGREVATAAVSALCAAAGVWGVRVHDVRASVDAVAVAAAWQQGGAALRTQPPVPAGADGG